MDLLCVRKDDLDHLVIKNYRNGSILHQELLRGYDNYDSGVSQELLRVSAA
jgi:hypothetical protein